MPHAKLRLAVTVALASVPFGCRDDHAAAGDGRADSSGDASGDATSADADTGADESGASGVGSESTGGAADVCAELEFVNLVDAASCPWVQAQGIVPLPAGDAELCRRLFVDLVGRIPTTDELASGCAGLAAGDIVDALMAGDDYVRVGQRRWADRFRMTSVRSYYEYVAALDEVVGQLYRGEILLPEFAAQAATHPGFTSRFAGQDLVGYSFQMFLGRDAAPHERKDLLGLWRMWGRGYIDMHPDYYFGYETVLVSTGTCAFLPGLCHSDLWGHQSVILPAPDPSDPFSAANLLELDTLDAAQWEELRKPGTLIAAQPTFYETAVDEALERYLGYDAGVQMPPVQQVLVDLLEQTGGDVRALEREILTSQLYTTTAAFPDPEGTPPDGGAPDPWHGPMKQMQAEAWLDSVELLTGFEYGWCDHRFPDVVSGTPTPDAFDQIRFHPHGYPQDAFNYAPEANAPDYTYSMRARRLGGCPDQLAQTRFTGTGVMISLAHGQILQEACGYLVAGVPLVPADFDAETLAGESLRAIAFHMLDAATLGTASVGAEDLVEAAVAGCEQDGDCNGALLGAQLCGAILQSAPFVYY